MIKNLIIQLNSECNLDCSYCYSKNRLKINKNKIRESINNILRTYKKIDNITITGGEPLLEYDFLLSILKGIENNKIKKWIITNGLLLNPERVNELKLLGTNIKISIDGFSRAEEKKPDKKLLMLIKNNKNYLKSVSKVITKKNINYLYSDFLKLKNLGFWDIDIIPQMYVYWNKKEINLMINQIKKIIYFCRKNKIKTNLTESIKNNYHKCNKIRILPNGDISLCNSLNAVKTTHHIKNDDLGKFENFRKKIIKNALDGLSKKKWFKPEYLTEFCIVDSFYYNQINKKDDKWLRSAIDLFSSINQIIKSE